MARERSRTTVTAAATRAALIAIRVIRQPAVPPTLTTRTVVAGSGVTRLVPLPPDPGTTAKAAGTATTDASRLQMTAASAAAGRRRREPVLRTGVMPGECGGGPGRDGFAVTPGRGAQVRAAIQGVVHVQRHVGPGGDLERFAHVRRGVLGAARQQVQHRQPSQQLRRTSLVARSPARPTKLVSAGAKPCTALATAPPRLPPSA